MCSGAKITSVVLWRNTETAKEHLVKYDTFCLNWLFFLLFELLLEEKVFAV